MSQTNEWIARVLKRNNVTVFGNPHGETLLFAHGFGCDQDMWRFVTPAFEDTHRIVLFDYVGCGKSDKSAYRVERYNSLSGYAEDVLDICAALDLKQVLFVGHSVSSMIGILAAIQEPTRFHRLLLVCPSPRYINESSSGNNYTGGFERADIEGLLELMEKNYLGWASFLAPVVMKNDGRPHLTQQLQESFCAMDPEIAQRFARITFLSDNRRDLPNVTVPSLILQASDDAIAPLEVGNYVHAHLPQSTLKVMQATGHCPHMSHPEETIQRIQEYLAAPGNVAEPLRTG